jgi:AcrR family transcriptional regulator
MGDLTGSQSMTTRRRSRGRPRHVPSTSTASPRDQVLDAAAELFVTRGFAATSTREIAEEVGIRQASLYYRDDGSGSGTGVTRFTIHFAGKDEILAELLQRSVRPTVDKIAKIEALVPPETHETALYLLTLVDIRTLAEAPQNVGILYGLPDVTSSEIYSQFRDARQELVDAYSRLGIQIASPPVLADTDARLLGEMLTHQVEITTALRNLGRAVTREGAHGMAASCLRICGVAEIAIATAASTAAGLLAEFQHEIPSCRCLSS